MKKNNKGENTICAHEGEVVDTQFGGSVSPIFVSTSYEYINKDISRYPRYFNTPNQEALCKKISALECSESAMIFGSGMAAISTTLLAFLSSGDHILLQKDIYGGTRNLVEAQFDRYNIDYTFTDDINLKDFKSAIKKNTKVIYIETPSNPLLKIIDIEKIAEFAKSKDISSDQLKALVLTRRNGDLIGTLNSGISIEKYEMDGSQCKVGSYFCTDIKSVSINDWIGLVEMINSNVDGSFYPSIAMPSLSDINQKTSSTLDAGSTLYNSDRGYNYLIKPSNPLYEIVAYLKPMDKVLISGEFFIDEDTGYLATEELFKKKYRVHL